jgi:hypothetical protein
LDAIRGSTEIHLMPILMPTPLHVCATRPLTFTGAGPATLRADWNTVAGHYFACL